MKYCRETTENHPIAIQYGCCIDLKILLLRDGCESIPNILAVSEKPVIDGDKLEEKISLSQNRKERYKSMDVIFCIDDNEVKKVQFVELKFNMMNVNNLVKDNLEYKIKGSTNAIGEYYTINENYYFVFCNENKKEEAKNRIDRMYPKPIRNFIPICTDELTSLFF